MKTTATFGCSSLPALPRPGRIGALFLALGLFFSPSTQAGPVEAWGSNNSGQSAVPAGLDGVVAIAAGNSHSLALKSDGTVEAWGFNNYGQIAVPGGLSGVVAIDAGGDSSLALRSDGTVVAWGYKSAVPAGLEGVVAIAQGGAHFLALKRDGTVVGAGDNSVGQITVPPGLIGVVAIAAGDVLSMALKSDGTVVAWGGPKPFAYNYGEKIVPDGLSGVVAIAAKDQHCLALKSDGTVVAWGDPTNGLNTVPLGLSGVVAIAAGVQHSLALKSDGKVVAWGSNSASQSTVPTGLGGVGSIAGGGNHSMALAGNPAAPPVIVSAPLARSSLSAFYYRIAATGSPTGFSAADLPSGLSLDPSTGVITGSPADQGTFSITLSAVNGAGTGSATLTLFVYGIPTITSIPPSIYGLGEPLQFNLLAANGPVTWSASGLPPGVSLNPMTGALSGELPQVGSFTAILTATNRFGQASAVWTARVSGVVVAWGMAPSPPVGLAGVTAIAAGVDFYLMLKRDGTVMARGGNSSGQSTVPAGLNGVVGIAAGGVTGDYTFPVGSTTIGHSLALKSDGTVVAWGSNSAGQRTVPAGLTGVVAIAAGGLHSLALKSDGTVEAWGANDSGQITVPSGLSGVVAIAAGGQHSMALQSDGTVVIWGSNLYGQSAVPPGLSNVTAIAAGYNHSLALKSDGTTVTWGFNSYGRAPMPEGLRGVVAIAAGGALNPSVSPGPILFESVALMRDGTVVSWGAEVHVVPTGLGGVAAVAAGANFSLALLSAPAQTSARSVGGTAGSAFAYQTRFISSQAPTRAGGLPPGLTLNETTGLISGTPSAAGVFDVAFAAPAQGGAGNVVITIEPASNAAALAAYHDWAAVRFPPGETRNAPLDDPDGDGQSNVMEFAQGTDPGAGNAPTVRTNLLPDGRLELVLDVPAAAAEVLLVKGEFSTHTDFAEDLEEAAPGLPLVTTAGMVRYRFAQPSPGARSFGRIRVILPLSLKRTGRS